MVTKQQKDFSHTLLHLDAGMVQKKLTEALSAAAIGTVNFDKQGEVTLNFKIKRMSDTGQVGIAHTVKSVVPTANGKITEENTTNTAMWVHTSGLVTVTSEKQGDIFDAEMK